MKSDDKKSRDKISKGDKASGKPKRPSRVIDLEAAEVEAETQEKPDGEDNITGAARTDTSAEPETSEQKPSASPPPQRTKPSDIKSFVTHLAAGLAGGLIGVIGVGVVLDRLAVDPPDNSQAIAQLGQRLNSLDAKLKQAVDNSASGEALKTLAARISALESKPAAAAVDFRPVMDRVTKLEATLKTLASSGGQAGDGASAVAAADLQPVLDRLTKFENTLETLKSSGADTGDGASGAVRALEEHLAALEMKIGKLASRPSAPSPQAASGSGSTALALTFASLRRTIDRGEPFDGALKRVQEIAPPGLELQALAQHAGAGIGSDTALLIALAPALNAARAAAVRSEDDTFLGRLAANARSMVRVRRTGPVTGDTAEAVLSRMEAHMKAGDLTGVLVQALSLSGLARESLQPWLTRAKARRAVQAELEQLEAHLLTGLRSGRQR